MTEAWSDWLVGWAQSEAEVTSAWPLVMMIAVVVMVVRGGVR